MSRFTKLRDRAEHVVADTAIIPAAFQVGGASAANAAKNVTSGDPLTKHAAGAAAVDVLGLAGGAAVGASGAAPALWGGGAGAPAAEAAPFYSGADAEAFAAGINPETGEAMNLGAEQLGIEGTDVGSSAGDVVAGTAGVPVAGPGSVSGVPGTAAAGGNALTRYGPLALGAAGLAQNYFAGKKAADRIAHIGDAQRAEGQQLLNQYNSGQLTVSDAHTVAAYEASATAQAKQYFAKAGMSDSSSAASTMASIQGNVAAMKDQMLQNYLKLGTSMLNVTDKYQLEAIEASIKNDQDMWKMIFGFGATYGAWNRSLNTMTA